jgi:hypothetical protein
MPLDDDGPVRSVREIENDFAEVLASPLPAAIALDKLERLWNDANLGAGLLLPEEPGLPYLALLKRLQETFDRYRSSAAPIRLNGHR